MSAVDDPGGAKEHMMLVLAREYWRCAGLAENAKLRSDRARDEMNAFVDEQEKWQARMRVLKDQLGGEIPENIPESEYAERMELAPTEGD